MKEMVGVMPLTEAMGMATASGMDVILINESAQPPLVRICSVSKYKYEIEKVKKEAQKKQRASQQELKELKLSPRTEVHDLEVRLLDFYEVTSTKLLLLPLLSRYASSLAPYVDCTVHVHVGHVEIESTAASRPMHARSWGLHRCQLVLLSASFSFFTPECPAPPHV